MKPKHTSKSSKPSSQVKKATVKPVSKPSLKKTAGKTGSKKSVKKPAPIKQVVKATAKKDVKPTKEAESKGVRLVKTEPKKVLSKSTEKTQAEAGKKALRKTEGEGKKRGRKKKTDEDDEEANVVIENIEIKPDPTLIPKKVSQKDKAKERIQAKLREKLESELSKRTYLPTKKKKYTLEYIIKSSPIILWDFVTTSSGLALWFADEVDDHLDIFTFTWEGHKQQAEVVEYEDLEYIKFRWIDNPYDEYFEFRITSTEITGDTVLLITDFAEQYELRDVQMLWDSQIKNLMMRLGLGN